MLAKEKKQIFLEFSLKTLNIFALLQGSFKDSIVTKH